MKPLALNRSLIRIGWKGTLGATPPALETWLSIRGERDLTDFTLSKIDYATLLGCYLKGNVRVMLEVMIRPISVLRYPLYAINTDRGESLLGLIMIIDRQSRPPSAYFSSGTKKERTAKLMKLRAQSCAGGYACSVASSMMTKGVPAA